MSWSLCTNSKCSGGIFIGTSDVREKDRIINESNGTTSGIIPLLSVFSDTAKLIDFGQPIGDRSGG